ncbi:MAG: pyrroline-5-carboxylate reductase [Ignisphaera sp.]|nr:pyrroline-5-carboxylate reductase [Ignisphaera sp.]
MLSGKTVAVIGAGRIGSAIIQALRDCYGGSVRIIATGRRDETIERARSLGAEATRDNREAVKEADIVILSVKPQHFPTVVKQCGRDVWSGKVVVSIMAGVRLKTLKSVLIGAEVFRAMTNMNILVKKGSTAIALPENDSANKGVVEEIFRCMGEVYWVPEELLDVWTSLAGSGPAFIAEIVDALVLGAVAVGMPRDLAYKAILDVLEGTAKLLRSRNDHPANLRDEVITPGGTTIRGVMVMESEGVKAALMKTVEAAYKRAAEIGNEIDAYIRRELGIE